MAWNFRMKFSKRCTTGTQNECLGSFVELARHPSSAAVSGASVVVSDLMGCEAATAHILALTTPLYRK